MLQPHGQAHQARGDPAAQLLGVRELAVGGARRVDDQAADVTDVGDVAVQHQRLDELLAGLAAALDLERQHRTGTARRVLAGPLEPRAALEPGVAHREHLGSLLEPGGDREGVLHVPLDAQAEGLDALADQEGVERRGRGTQVAQQLHPGLEDERQVRTQRAADAKVAGVDQPVIARVGLVVVGELLGVGGVVEGAAVDDDPRDRRAVPTEVLRGAVDDDVGAPLQGPDEVRGRHGVVDDQGDPRLVRHAGDALDVEDVLLGVGDGLGEERLRVRAHRRSPGVQVVGVLDERGGDAELGERVVQQVVRSAVQAGAGDDVVADLGEVEQRDRLGGLPAGHEQRPHPTLQARDALLDDVVRGVHQPGVDVAELLEPEQVRGVLRAFEHVGGGLVDRQRARPGRGVGALAGVDLSRLEGPAIVHRGLPTRRGPLWADPRLPTSSTRAGSSPGAPHRGWRVAGQRAGACRWHS